MLIPTSLLPPLPFPTNTQATSRANRVPWALHFGTASSEASELHIERFRFALSFSHVFSIRHFELYFAPAKSKASSLRQCTRESVLHRKMVDYTHGTLHVITTDFQSLRGTLLSCSYHDFTFTNETQRQIYILYIYNVYIRGYLWNLGKKGRGKMPREKKVNGKNCRGKKWPMKKDWRKTQKKMI